MIGCLLQHSARDALNLNEQCGCSAINAGCTAYVEGVALAYDFN